MRFLPLAILLCCVLSCSTEEQPTAVDTAAPIAVHMLALGDSYTIGQSVSLEERWPEQLAQALERDAIDVTHIVYVASTGWTTTDLQAAVDQFKGGRHRSKTPFDIVSLLIGVNNQFRGLDVAAYAPEFERLLQEAIAFAGGDPRRVMVLSIPDYGVTPVGRSYDTERIGREIDQYNAVNRGIAQDYDVRYVDVTPISRQAEGDPSLIADDGLHPSGKMYGEWVSLMRPSVVELLRTQTIP